MSMRLEGSPPTAANEPIFINDFRNDIVSAVGARYSVTLADVPEEDVEVGAANTRRRRGLLQTPNPTFDVRFVIKCNGKSKEECEEIATDLEFQTTVLESPLKRGTTTSTASDVTSTFEAEPVAPASECDSWYEWFPEDLCEYFYYFLGGASFLVLCCCCGVGYCVKSRGRSTRDKRLRSFVFDNHDGFGDPDDDDDFDPDPALKADLSIEIF
jgi:hypothetical protein